MTGRDSRETLAIGLPPKGYGSDRRFTTEPLDGNRNAKNDLSGRTVEVYQSWQASGGIKAEAQSARGIRAGDTTATIPGRPFAETT